MIEAKKKFERNLGIDFLRIVSMLMIVVLHVLGQGGVLNSSIPLSSNYKVAWLMETASYCAVNCYALISGYVGYKSKPKLSSITGIWLQVAFYTVGIGVIAAPIFDNFDKSYVLKTFFPVSNNFYWYFTAYFCIYFFTPFFNKIIKEVSDKRLKNLAILLFLMFSVLPTFAKQDLFFTNKGYSALWLAVLYILGGIIAKCELFKKLNSFLLFLIYIASVALSWGVKIYCESKNPPLNDLRNIFISYTSPTIIISAIALLVWFSKMKIGKISGAIIKFFAPLTFGIYLVHVNKVIWNNFMKNRFVEFSDYTVFKLIIAVIIAVFLIFIVCAIIEFIRIQLFKLFRINKLLKLLDTKIQNKILK